MPRVIAFVLTVIALTSCASKASNGSAIYVSTDYTIDQPNPTVAGIPRYINFRDARQINVYFPRRIKGTSEWKPGTSFVWAMDPWQVEHIKDHPGETGEPLCCHFHASWHGKTKGTIFVRHLAQGDVLTWFDPFEPKLRQEHGYVRDPRRLPTPGSPYTFVPHLLKIRV